MAKRFLNSIRLVTLSSDPESASNGDVYYSDEEGKVKFYQNDSWDVIPESLEDLSDAIFSNLQNNDVLTYNSASAIWTNLPPSSGPATVEAGDDFPESPQNGSLFLKTSNLTLYFYTGGSWIELGSSPPIDGGTPETTTFTSVIDGGDVDSTFVGGISGGSPVQNYLLA